MAFPCPIQVQPPRLGASKEILEQCPYDKYHWVIPSKLGDHVAKCRYNHQVKLMEKGENIPVVTCFYNRTHEVHMTEWSFHLGRCPDRKVIRSYQLQVGELKHAHPESFPYGMEDFALDKQELEELYGGLNVGKVMGTYRWGKAYDIEEIKYPKRVKQRAAEDRGMALAKELEKMEVEGNKESESVMMEYTQEELEEWNQTSKGPGFNYMLNTSFPQGGWTRFPPWMNKAQRREFEKWNSISVDKGEAEKKTAGAAGAEGQAEEEQETSTTPTNT